jgi:hypothetical protein
LDSDNDNDKDNDMDRHRVRRDSDRDLTFTGTLLGTGERGTGGSSGNSCDWTRATEVEIYLTEGAKIVTAVRQWSRWQGEADVHRAAVHDHPADAFEWLVEDAGGRLGTASKEAWEEACENCPLLAGADVEEVA